MANKVLGMHRLNNKVNRNAFDLSHRYMFTAQVGELLPVFTQWVNPNETFKIGYNGKTRTAALNTDAFTRIRENIQYYFVLFQSLWKYFEQQVNNMTKVMPDRIFLSLLVVRQKLLIFLLLCLIYLIRIWHLG